MAYIMLVVPIGMAIDLTRKDSNSNFWNYFFVVDVIYSCYIFAKVIVCAVDLLDMFYF